MNVHICGIPNGPYRYDGYFFEVHPYLGPCELKADGDPKNIPVTQKFNRVWQTFDKLSQADKDLYATSAVKEKNVGAE